MKIRHLIAVSIAALTLTSSAGATDPYQLANLGYSMTGVNLANGCTEWSAVGFGASANFGSTCDAGFSATLDTFAAGHPERKLGFQHPAAVSARASITGKGYTVTTDYAGPSFRVVGGCNVNATVDGAGLVGLNANLPIAAPCPPPPTPPTLPAPPEAPAPPGDGAPAPPPAAPENPPTVDERLAALEAALAALSRRVTAIEEANRAAWNALTAALTAGYEADEAALAARSAGMNAIYQLGDGT